MPSSLTTAKNAACTSRRHRPHGAGHAEELGRAARNSVRGGAGYEVVYRIASHVNPAQIHKGFHPSGNDGTFGAMAVAGSCWGSTPKSWPTDWDWPFVRLGLMEPRSRASSPNAAGRQRALNGISAAYIAQSGWKERAPSSRQERIFAGAVRKCGYRRHDEDLERCTPSRIPTISSTTCATPQPAIEAVLDLARSTALPGKRWRRSG
jgi:2-methylcitrate dehydratase PrpD